jgi:hypothetical protein
VPCRQEPSPTEPEPEPDPVYVPARTLAALLVTCRRPPRLWRTPGRVVAIEAYFTAYLCGPQLAHAAAIDWSTLKLEDGHYVDLKLAGSQSDLLYSASLGDGAPVLFYFLFEHQSRSDPLMPLRLLRYMTRIWDRWIAGRRSRPKRIPAIIPVVMSHAPGGWSAATSMHELFDPRVVRLMGKHLPGFEFVLDDLWVQSNQQLFQRAASASAILAMVLLRNVKTSRDVLGLLRSCGWLIRAVYEAPNGPELLFRFIRYVMEVAQEPPPGQELREEVDRQLGPAAGEIVMTLAEQWIAEGVARGLAQGEARGRADAFAQAVLGVLEERGLAIPEAVRVRVLSCTDLPTLHGWVRRAARCGSADELV